MSRTQDLRARLDELRFKKEQMEDLITATQEDIDSIQLIIDRVEEELELYQ